MKEYWKNLHSKISAVPKHVWILALIMIVGVFLRTYNFHDWLDFRLDQVRDATLVREVVEGKTSWPEFGPTMRKSAASKDALFRIGPAYYYFQIASAKIFGSEPESMAYPDLFFSVLAIPLFYFFLRKYFQNENALLLTAIFSFSYFAILYSRFAWNPNSIPFFVSLFLLALHEFLIKEEKVHWGWVMAAGVALGIGVQLHAILFVLLPAVTAVTALFLLKKNQKTWKGWLVIFLIALALNFGQVISELRTGFVNTKILFSSPVSSAPGKNKLLVKIENTFSCQLEANGYILSSLGPDICARWYGKVLQGERITSQAKGLEFWVGIAASFIFSLVGYGLLIYYFFREKGKEKKYFLGLVCVFSALSFVVMIPIVGAGFLEFRYFIHTFFIPFILLGFLLEYMYARNKKAYNFFAVLVLLFLIFSNGSALQTRVVELSSGNASDDNSVFLGETEAMVEYVTANAGNQGAAYISGEGQYVKNFFQPFNFLAKQRNFEFVQSQDLDNLLDNQAIFYIRGASKAITREIKGYAVEDYKKFGQVVIYKLKR